jgi:hypothetical protein
MESVLILQHLVPGSSCLLKADYDPIVMHTFFGLTTQFFKNTLSL